MAYKNGQRVQTKRNSRNKHNFEKRQGYDIRIQNKRKANKHLTRQRKKPNQCAEFYMKQNVAWW